MTKGCTGRGHWYIIYNYGVGGAFSVPENVPKSEKREGRSASSIAMTHVTLALLLVQQVHHVSSSLS